MSTPLIELPTRPDEYAEHRSLLIAVDSAPGDRTGAYRVDHLHYGILLGHTEFVEGPGAIFIPAKDAFIDSSTARAVSEVLVWIDQQFAPAADGPIDSW